MAYIKAISYFLPEKVVTNEDLVSDFPEWTVEKIASKIGVNQRHVASESETATDLAVIAAQKLFNDYPDVSKDNIDFILFCTQSPDYFLPSSACIIQDRLELSSDCGAFDYNLGCSGYIYGLAIAKGLISGNIASNVLLLTAETYNKYLHSRDKGNRTIFGDAATATLISKNGYAKIEEFSLGTDGSGAENLILKTGASKNPKKAGDLKYDENGNPISSDYLYMNGAEIFSFTQKNVPVVVNKTIEKNCLLKDDIDLFVFHQANSYMLSFLQRKLRIPPKRFFVNMTNIGNTVSNSIPIALCEAKEQNLLKGNVLLCGFGVGYSWGGVVINIK